MTKNIDEMKNDEINRLSQDEEIYDLEELIIGGTKTFLPITVEFPLITEDGVKNVKTQAKIKPVSSVDVHNATKIGLKVNNTSPELEIVKRGLYNSKDELFKPELLDLIPAGVISEIASLIAKASGVKQNTEEQLEFTKNLMGF